jgi:zinc finger SWIM domain-containing protein 3
MRFFSQNMETNVVTIPQVGMQFDTVEDAWKFWLNYGKQMGFDVRKHYINKSKKDGKVTSRGFVCAKEGFRDIGDSLGIRDRDDTRCNCHVRL